MNRIEVHAKTKYSKDYDSVIDVESIMWNAKENKERGIIFIDKDTIYGFPKIEKSYKRLCLQDKSFKDFKVGYGVELTALINRRKYQVLLVVNKQEGLNNLYKIINKYNKQISIKNILDNKEGLLLGLIYDKKYKLDLSIFDYIEINKDMDCSNIKDKLIVYSNIPNSLFEGDQKGRSVLHVYRHIDKMDECRLYLDTEDTLKNFDNKEIIITNSNKFFDNLDNIVINDDSFHTTVIDDFNSFKELVINSFNRIYSNPSDKMINRLNEELQLTKDLNYTYYFDLLLMITNYCKDNKQPYLIGGYTNNSLISYVLGITRIEPYNLPYELFYSNTPSINIMVDPSFYYKKLYIYMNDKYNLIKCKYGFKINKENVFRVIKNYEIKTHTHLDLEDKDYISNLLIDIPIYNDLYSNSFCVLPDKYLIPYDKEGTLYDYHELSNNLIMIKVLPNDNIKYISDIKICNNRYVYNLFRLIKDDIIYYEDLKYELENTSNLWFDDLVNLLIKKYNLLIEDDIYNYLKSINLDDINIYNIINRLKEEKKVIAKANIINKAYLAYSYVYNKYL